MSEVWDDVWSHKKVRSDYSIRLYSYLASLRDKLPDSTSVIEVGCGSGEGLAQFRGEGMRVVGIDLSPEALVLARQCSSASLSRADAFRLPFKSQSFDLAYNSGVIEHFRYPRNLELVKEMARVTRKGGHVLVLVPNKRCLWYRMLKTSARAAGKWEFGYEEDYSHGQLVDLFIEAGLEPKESLGLLVLPPMATNNRELVSENIRRRFMVTDRIFPKRHLYAYATGILGRKR